MMRFSLIAALVLLAFPGSGHALDTKARAAMVVDHHTGTVLLAKNADEALPPASMSKLMTLELVFNALQSGRLQLSDTFRVSTKAWKMGGSKMFLREGKEVTVEDLIRGVIVQSGNDACVVLAEGLAGSEASFAERMTKRARDLGMTSSTFANATGWPHPDQRMSAEDLVRLASHLIDTYPEYYPYFSERSFTWEGIDQENRNPLLSLDVGADGLKTGHTQEAGYGLVGSAIRDDRRITFMLTGLPSARDRLVESERLVNWAFREFYSETIFKPSEPVEHASVWVGDVGDVPLISESLVNVIVPYEDRAGLTAQVVYEGPIAAPITKGQRLAKLVVTTPGLGEKVFPLVAAENVARGGMLKRVSASAQILGSRVFTSLAGLIN